MDTKRTGIVRRAASSAAYAVMNRTVALAPAYPPLIGDPARAAPLDIVTTTPPFGGGVRRACWTKWKACRTSTFQLTLKVSQSCSSSGADHGGCACVKDDCGGPVGAEQPRRQFGVGDVTGLAAQRIAEFSLQFLQPTAVAGDADHLRAGLGQGDGRGPPEPAADAGDDHRGAVEIYSCHFVAPRWLAGSVASEVLIRAGSEIHRSVSCAKWA